MGLKNMNSIIGVRVGIGRRKSPRNPQHGSQKTSLDLNRLPNPYAILPRKL